MTATPTEIALLTTQRRDRLVGLAAWVAGEEAKRRLGQRSEWNQRSWFWVGGCGTTCCIAGKVALDDGALPVLYDQEGDEIDPGRVGELWYGPSAGLAEYEVADEEIRVPGRTAPVPVWGYAREVLGLTRRQANELFDGTNTCEDVLRQIAQLLGADLLPADAE